ncbi:DUF87 domain-containing protein [Paenibacillus sp. TRM 82003]|nr:DUF87 domain-containing protein [Paenibacillus sp. TRM 82003]
MFQRKEEIEVKLNAGFTAARDILEFIHHHATDEKPVVLYIHYREEQLRYFLQIEGDVAKQALPRWVPNCEWEEIQESLDTGFAKEKVTLRGCASPLVLKDREQNLIDELIRSLPKETFLIQLKLGMKNKASVEQGLKQLEAAIDELSRQSALQIGEQGDLADKFDKMIFGGGNVSYQLKRVGTQQKAELLENHLYILGSQGAVFREAEFHIYAGRGIATLIASKMESFSRRSGALTLHRLHEGEPFKAEYLNYVNSHFLASLVALPMTNTPGLTGFERTMFGSETAKRGVDALTIGRLVTNAETDLPVDISLRDLTKHAFIAGVTGSGKTSTIKSLLAKAYRRKKPFLVMEPAKTEYKYLERELPTLQRYTLGIEGAFGFKINPFAFPPGIHIQTHLDHLKSVFIAAFPMYGPMPYILETAFYRIYRRTGWDFVSGRNVYEDRMQREALFPTLEDLYAAIDPAIEAAGYSADLTSDIRGALKVRIGSLLSGAKGAMLNVSRGVDIGKLLLRPTILELESVGDDQEKVFLMGLILISIYEHYIAKEKHSSDLEHVIVIEEAHRLLENVRSSGNPESADMKGKAVEMFNNMLSEIRTYGQGIIVADQIPTKLSPDIIKNTNLKILHRLFAKDDRQLAGDAIGLEEDGMKELIRLKQGEAVVFHGDLIEPVKVKIAVDASVLAEGQAAPQHPEFIELSVPAYLLQQDGFVAEGVMRVATSLLFPERCGELEQDLIRLAEEQHGVALRPSDTVVLWGKLAELFLTVNRIHERIPYFKYVPLMEKLREAGESLRHLSEELERLLPMEASRHPMAAFSNVYDRFARFRHWVPGDTNSSVVAAVSRSGGQLAEAEACARQAAAEMFAVKGLSREQLRAVTRAILLYEFRDTPALLENWFEVKDFTVQTGLSM